MSNPVPGGEMATAKIQTVKGLRVKIFLRTLRKNTTRPLPVWIVGTEIVFHNWVWYNFPYTDIYLIVLSIVLYTMKILNVLVFTRSNLACCYAKGYNGIYNQSFNEFCTFDIKAILIYYALR